PPRQPSPLNPRIGEHWRQLFFRNPHLSTHPAGPPTMPCRRWTFGPGPSIGSGGASGRAAAGRIGARPPGSRGSRAAGAAWRAGHSPSEGTPMQPRFNQENANDLIREFQQLAQQVVQLEKRLDKQSNVLRAVFELVQDELHIAPAALVEKLAAVLREKADRAKAACAKCNRPLGDKAKCMYCGTERRPGSIF